MNRIISLLFFINFSFLAFSQTANKTSSPKNGIKISPTTTIDWSKSLKLKTNTSHLNTGFTINYQRQDKLNNYHDIGFLIGFIPLNKKKTNSYSGKQFGVEYNYKLVFAKFKNNKLEIYTAVGTQLIYQKLKSGNTILPVLKTNSFIQHFTVSPGFQYTKNNFFLDLAIPTSIGYSISKQPYFYPLNSTEDPSIIQNDSQKNNLLNWNIGIKAGVGAKF